MTGCKNATSAVKRTLAPISEATVGSGAAGAITMRAVMSNDYLGRPLFPGLWPQNTGKILSKYNSI